MDTYFDCLSTFDYQDFEYQQGFVDSELMEFYVVEVVYQDN